MWVADRWGRVMDTRVMDRGGQIARLRSLLGVCPGDILARSQLAVLLEEVGQYEEALFNWKMVLTCDPNSLNAREGFARCRRRAGH
jgi:cytochrome c-type biogenesis protein CcmH/NrfG